MKYTLEKVETIDIDINFEHIEQYLRDVNNGVFVDDFTDNLEHCLKAIYGIDFSDTAENDAVLDEIFYDWQDYMEDKGLID